jgi:hypothetical protein
MSFRSKEPHNFLRTKTKKSKAEKSDSKQCPSTSSSKTDLDDGGVYVGELGRSGRRNTLPNLFADAEEMQRMISSKDKQKSHEDLQLPAIHNEHKGEHHLPFLDSLIKRKNKLRQSFHGTISSSLPSSNKL